MKKIVIGIVIIISLITIIDYSRVIDSKVPIFTINQMYKDGGSVVYRGIIYKYEVYGSLDIDYGFIIDSKVFYLLGIPVDVTEKNDKSN